MFADHVTRNLRDGRIVVLIVGDEIRPEADELVAGLQAHANFHFTFALVEMPVYSRSHADSADEFIVMPRTLVKTVTVPRFTIRTEGRLHYGQRRRYGRTGSRKTVETINHFV